MAKKRRKIHPELITDLRPIARNQPYHKKIISKLQSGSRLKKNVLLALIVAVGLITFFLSRGHGHSKNDLDFTKSRVGKLMILPKDEQPTLATVEDKAKLKDKFLISKAETGDKILIYTKNHIVVIYRPSINKVAAVGTVNSDPALAEAQNTSLTILDSTNNPSKTQEIIDKIKAAYPKLKITDGGKTNRQNFPYTIVIDEADQKPELRDALIKAAGGKRGFQPSSEDSPATDFLVIVGQD
jgi:hypothetical protein